MLLIAAATAKELTAALAWAGPLPGTPEGRPVPWPVLRPDAWLLVTGVGPVNAALSLGAALGRLGALGGAGAGQDGRASAEAGGPLRGVLNLGVAGSFDLARLPLGAVTAVTAEIWPEYGLRRADGVAARDLGFPLWRADRDADGTPDAVWDRIDLDPAGAALGLKPSPDWPDAVSLTVAGVTAEPALAQDMRRRHAADLENMEGFALALGCLRAGLRFLEIRAVSHLSGSRAARDWALQACLAGLERAARTLFA